MVSCSFGLDFCSYSLFLKLFLSLLCTGVSTCAELSKCSYMSYGCPKMMCVIKLLSTAAALGFSLSDLS